MTLRRLVPLPERTCDNPDCNKTFTPHRTDQRYCTTYCRHAAGNRRKGDGKVISHEERLWNSVVDGVKYPGEEKLNKHMDF